MTACWTPGCIGDGAGTYFCPRCWLLVKSDERAALRMAYASPLYPPRTLVASDDGLELDVAFLEVRMVARAIAPALLERMPAWRRAVAA